MKVENQVSTFEQSKKLEELGVKGESMWYWNTIQMESNPMLSLYNKDTDIQGFFKGGFNAYDGIDISDFESPYYSAFTASELSLLLPYKNISYRKIVTGAFTAKYDDSKEELPTGELNFGGYSLVDILASMLIYLLENNIINVQQCNNRLNG